MYNPGLLLSVAIHMKSPKLEETQFQSNLEMHINKILYTLIYMEQTMYIKWKPHSSLKNAVSKE